MGLTAVHYAIRKGNYQIVEILVNAGADIKSKLNNNDLLAFAVEAGNPKTIKILIKAGLDPLKKINGYQNVNANNVTMLMVAASVGAVETGKILIEYGVDVNAVDSFGDHALNWAAYYNQPDFIRLLIENNSKLNVIGFDKRTALDYAINNGNNPEVVNLLKKAGVLSAKDLK